MPSNVTVHFSVHSDRRYDRLGELLGSTRQHAVGSMVDLWSLCTDMKTDTPPLGRIRACLGPKGPEALVESELGEKLDDGLVRVKGRTDEKGRDRLNWRAAKQKAGALGGKAAQAVLKQKRARDKHPSSTAQAEVKHQTSTSEAPAKHETSTRQASVTQGSKIQDPVIQEQGSQKVPGGTGFKESVAAFFTVFEKATGTKPRWREEDGKNLNDLIRSHGAAEVQRRLVEFGKPRRFPDGMDFRTFVAHFDKFTGAQQSIATGRSEPKQPHEYPEGDQTL